MKQIKFSLFAGLLFLSLASQAQFFVGGGVSLSSQGGTYKSGTTSRDLDSDFKFDFSPMAGYFLSEKLCAGAMITFGNEKAVHVLADVTDYSSSFGIAPFARYYPVKVNKFSVYMQGTAGIHFSSSKQKDAGVTTDGPKNTLIGFSVSPGLEYDLTEKISLETGINFLSLGFYQNTAKETVGNVETTTTNNGFTFGAGLDNILSVNAITIGAIYRF